MGRSFRWEILTPDEAAAARCYFCLEGKTPYEKAADRIMEDEDGVPDVWDSIARQEEFISSHWCLASNDVLAARDGQGSIYSYSDLRGAVCDLARSAKSNDEWGAVHAYSAVLSEMSDTSLYAMIDYN